MLPCPGFLPPLPAPSGRLSTEQVGRLSRWTPAAWGPSHPQLPWKPIRELLPSDSCSYLLLSRASHPTDRPTDRDVPSVWRLTTPCPTQKSSLVFPTKPPTSPLCGWYPIPSEARQPPLAPLLAPIADLGVASAPQKCLTPSFFRPSRSLCSCKNFPDSQTRYRSV